MIRINLLGVPRQKKGKRGGGGGGGTPDTPGQGPSALIFMVLGLLIGGGVAYYLFYSANNESKRLAAAMTQATADGASLQGVKVKYTQREKEKAAFEARLKVIDQLQADKKGPVNLLTTVGQMVNNTDAVWLNDMKETGTSVDISGTALSTIAVAKLMTNLKQSGHFKSVEIKSAAQDQAVKDMTAFNFVLICEKLPKT